jgi:hypothetical protein
MRRVSFLNVAALIAAVPLHTIAQSHVPTAPATAVNTARQELHGTHSQAFSTIRGSVLNVDGSAIPDSVVRLRDARSGRIAASTVTDKAGSFTFRTIDPGSYIVEVLGADHNVVAASQILNVNAGETASTVVKLPFRTRPYSGVLGHTVTAAILVTTAAATSGILATQIVGEQKSPRQ